MSGRWRDDQPVGKRKIEAGRQDCPYREQVIASVARWVDSVVIGLNLCPFARREREQGSLRFAVTEARDEDGLLLSLTAELEHLCDHPEIETTLLIHPAALADFATYNDFLDRCDALLVHLGHEGVFQIASFHPQYQFAGTTPDAAENYSNRSPYPMLHILREESVARAVGTHPDVGRIPADNIARLNALGVAKLQKLLCDCDEKGLQG